MIGQALPRSEIRAEIVRFLMAAGGEHGEFEPFQAADQLGVQLTLLHGLGAAGRLQWTAKGPRIELEANASAERIRFTLCHELAHLAIAALSNRNELSAALLRLSPDEEERLCDRVAAKILMPEVTLDMGRDTISLKEIRGYAAQQSVSLAAAAARLIETRGLDVVFLRMRRFAAGWFVETSIAASDLSSLTLSDASTWTLDGGPDRSDFAAELEFLSPRGSCSAFCDCQIWHPGGRLVRGPAGSTAILAASGLRTWLRDGL